MDEFMQRTSILADMVNRRMLEVSACGAAPPLVERFSRGTLAFVDVLVTEGLAGFDGCVYVGVLEHSRVVSVSQTEPFTYERPELIDFTGGAAADGKCCSPHGTGAGIGSCYGGACAASCQDGTSAISGCRNGTSDVAACGCGTSGTTYTCCSCGDAYLDSAGCTCRQCCGGCNRQFNCYPTGS